MNNDLLANVMSKITNYERLGRASITIYPVARMTKAVLDILNTHGYVGQVEQRETSRGRVVEMALLGKINRIGVIKPRYAVEKDEFEKYEKRYLPAQGFGVVIVSTAKGLMTLEDARKNNIGGRLIAYCY